MVCKIEVILQFSGWLDDMDSFLTVAFGRFDGRKTVSTAGVCLLQVQVLSVKDYDPQGI